MTIANWRDGTDPADANEDRAAEPAPIEHADGETTRPETPELEGRVPLPEEITGRASGTSDDLVALFANQSAEHMADGFRDGKEEDHVRPDEDPRGV